MWGKITAQVERPVMTKQTERCPPPPPQLGPPPPPPPDLTWGLALSLDSPLQSSTPQGPEYDPCLSTCPARPDPRCPLSGQA